MRVTILGCGSSAGVPMIGGPDGRGDWGDCDPSEPKNLRTRSSIVIEGADGQRLLVDTTPDLRAQLLAAAIPAIHAVLFTHAHADHIAGIDDVRILNRIIARPIEAFADARTLAELTSRFSYAFRPHDGKGFYRPVLRPITVQPNQTRPIAGMQVTLIDQDHGATNSIGLRIGRFAYSTDVVSLSETALATLTNLDTWVVDCFQRDRHPTHAWLAQVQTWVTHLKPRRTILTHLGPDMDWAWMQTNLPPTMEPAFDGMTFDVM